MVPETFQRFKVHTLECLLYSPILQKKNYGVLKMFLLLENRLLRTVVHAIMQIIIK